MCIHPCEGIRSDCQQNKGRLCFRLSFNDVIQMSTSTSTNDLKDSLTKHCTAISRAGVYRYLNQGSMALVTN